MVAAMMGQEQIIPVTGPLSTSLEGVKLFMKTVIAAKPWIREPSLIPLPWKYGGLLKEDEEGRKTVKVAVLWDDGVVRPHPPVLRALKEVAEKLKGVEGVEVVDWKPYKHEEASQIINTLYVSFWAKDDDFIKVLILNPPSLRTAGQKLWVPLKLQENHSVRSVSSS